MRQPQQQTNYNPNPMKPNANAKPNTNPDYDLNSSLTVKCLYITGRKVSKSSVTAAGKNFNFYPIYHLSVRVSASPGF